MSVISRSGTSLCEQALFYFVQKFFPDTINRYKLRWHNKTIELDLFIPSLNLFIEYDGSHWHENKIDYDNKKNKAINELGFRILHVREYGLPPLDAFNGDVIELFSNDDNRKDPFDYINLTLGYLAGLVEGPLSSNIISYCVDKQVYEQEQKYIYALRYPDTIEPNLSAMCGIEYWDEDTNYPLNPTHISKLDWAPAVLVCENKRVIPLPYSHRNYKTDCRISCQECCCEVFCPFIFWCKKDGKKKVNCRFVEQKVWAMIKRGESVTEYQFGRTFKRWLSEESDIADKIINMYLQYPVDAKERKRIASFLGCNNVHYFSMIDKDEFDIYSAF